MIFVQANNGRDALAKDMYSRLFNWLVNAINACTSVPDATQRPSSSSSSDRPMSEGSIFGSDKEEDKENTNDINLNSEQRRVQAQPSNFDSKIRCIFGGDKAPLHLAPYILTEEDRSIALLDIFGFESFKVYC